jgi:Protein of unknown function (DUF5818)
MPGKQLFEIVEEALPNRRQAIPIYKYSEDRSWSGHSLLFRPNIATTKLPDDLSETHLDPDALIPRTEKTACHLHELLYWSLKVSQRTILLSNPLRSRSGETGRVHSESWESTKFIWRVQRMRKLFLLLSILLLGLSWAIAQESTTPSSSSSSQSDSTGNSGRAARTGAGGQMSVEGCLSGSNGNFTITDKNGTSYQLTGDTAKLSEHVGHEVKITGTAATAGTGASGSTESSAEGTGQTLQVTSVKHISKTCKSGGTGMSH